MAKKAQRYRPRRRRKAKIIKRKPTLLQLIPFLIVGAVIALSLMNGVIVKGWNLNLNWDKIFQKTNLSVQPLPITNLDPQLSAVHFIDVGQGDATLLQSGGEYCLVDAGTAESEAALISYLNGMGVKKLKLLVMSHPHVDHIGGMNAVLQNFEVEQVLLPDFSKMDAPTTVTFERILDTITQKQIAVAVAKQGDAYAIGNATLTVLAAGVKTHNYNNLSPVLHFAAADLTAMLTGDGEKEVETDALTQGLPHVDVFKAGHHGSNTANASELLWALRPQLVGISCGQNNSYGHPHSEALQSFALVGAQVLRTDLQGSIVIVAQNGEKSVYTAKQAKAG